MRGTGQSETVPDDIGPIVLDRFYVRRLDLGPPVPVDQPEPGESAAAVIRFQYMFSENPATADPRGRLLDPDLVGVLAVLVLVFGENDLGSRAKINLR